MRAKNFEKRLNESLKEIQKEIKCTQNDIESLKNILLEKEQVNWSIPVSHNKKSE